MPNHDVRAVANWFWHAARKDGRSLTNMQLQKLPYIAYGYGLALLGEEESLIKSEQPLEAWPYGPVFPDLYYSLRQYGSGPVLEPIRQYSDDPYRSSEDMGPEIKEIFTRAEQEILQGVWSAYGKYSAYELSALTHRPGTPWTKTFETEGDRGTIPAFLIKDYYKKLLSA